MLVLMGFISLPKVMLSARNITLRFMIDNWNHAKTHGQVATEPKKNW
jgi:hypothetical protein